MARNVLAKTDDELARAARAGLSLLYIGPESGDDVTLKRIAKGDTATDTSRRRSRAHAGMELSVIALLGIAMDRIDEHARATARLVTKMDPRSSPRSRSRSSPDAARYAAREGAVRGARVPALLGELRTLVDQARPTSALFRTNHASNYLPLGGRLPATARASSP